MPRIKSGFTVSCRGGVVGLISQCACFKVIFGYMKMLNHLIWNNCVQVVFLSCLGLEIQVTWYFSDTLLLPDVLHKVYTVSYVSQPALFCKLVIFDILYWIHNLFVFFLVFVQGHRREWVHQLLRRQPGQSSLDHDWKSELHCAADQQSDITRQGATQSSL